MKILVTGATGFIGQCLCPILLKQGHEVWALVRTSSNVSKLPHSIKRVAIDSLNSWPEGVLAGFDVVIHLAARAHMLNDQATDPEAEFFRVNTQGTIDLAQTAMASGVKHFIFISSIGAMTTLSNLILTEQSTCQPDTPYGISKLQAEEGLISIASPSPMSWTVLRPTLVYGPGNPGNMERLLKLVCRGLPLPFSIIHNRRSLVYVENLVDAIALSIKATNAINQTFLVSDGHDISTPDLIKQIAFSLHKRPNLLPVPPKSLKLVGQLIGKSDTIDRLTGSLVVDSRKIRQTLNWTPPYTFQEGIQKTCDWYLHSR
jgi:nucleoside-diphosphate-sugar epimerase